MQPADETPLEMARRHVRTGEEHVVRQERFIADLRASGRDVRLAQKILAAQEEFLRLARAHVALLEARGANS